MKTKIKFYRGEVFATPVIQIPFAVNPVGIIFAYNEKIYKIIDAIYPGYDITKDQPITEEQGMPTFTVVEIPNL